MNDNEKVAALAAALTEMQAEREWYRSAWLEASREREAARASGMQYHAAWFEENRERDRLETELEHAQNTVARLREQRDEARYELSKHYGQRGPTCVKWLAEGGMREVLDILSQPHPVNVSEAAAAHLERGLGTNMIWARQVVAQINAWWQDAREAE